MTTILNEILQLTAPHLDVASLVRLSRCSRHTYNLSTNILVLEHAYNSLPADVRPIITLIRSSDKLTFSTLNTMVFFEKNCARLEEYFVNNQGFPGFTISRKETLYSLERYGALEALNTRIISKHHLIEGEWCAYMTKRMKSLFSKETFLKNEKETVGHVLYWLLLQPYCNFEKGDPLTNRCVSRISSRWMLLLLDYHDHPDVCWIANFLGRLKNM